MICGINQKGRWGIVNNGEIWEIDFRISKVCQNYKHNLSFAQMGNKTMYILWCLRSPWKFELCYFILSKRRPRRSGGSIPDSRPSFHVTSLALHLFPVLSDKSSHSRGPWTLCCGPAGPSVPFSGRSPSRGGAAGGRWETRPVYSWSSSLWEKPGGVTDCVMPGRQLE